MSLFPILKKIFESRFQSEEQNISLYQSPKELSKNLNLEINDSPSSFDQIEDFINKYLKYSVNTQSKKFANQLWSKTEPLSVIGEFLGAVTNTSMYTYEVAPVATLLENKMISYLSELIWGKTTDGIMTSGGSASNLQALLVARNIKIEHAKNQGLATFHQAPVIFAAKNAHYSIKRAVNILGLGHEGLVEICTKDDGSMCAHDLKNQIINVKKEGKYPFCLVSTAGTTIEGSYDNLSELSEICKKNHLWFHVDGAYGGSVLLSSVHKSLLRGIDLVDSFSWDFHKMLGLNLPCAFLFLKDSGILKNTLSSGNDSYLFHDHVDDSINLGPKSMQCGRKNDIVKLWLMFMAEGKSGFETRINKLFNTTLKFAQMVENERKLILLQQPSSINVCFRYRSEKRLEEKIRNYLIKNGLVMLNYSNDDDGPFFRMAITRPDLNESDLDFYIQNIIKAGDELC